MGNNISEKSISSIFGVGIHPENRSCTFYQNVDQQLLSCFDFLVPLFYLPDTFRYLAKRSCSGFSQTYFSIQKAFLSILVLPIFLIRTEKNYKNTFQCDLKVYLYIYMCVCVSFTCFGQLMTIFRRQIATS
jgi:hypothetical protein